MTGFTRTPPTELDLARFGAYASAQHAQEPPFQPEYRAILELLIPPADPFNVADPCLSPEGHLYHREGNEVFCPHCSKRFW